MSLTFGTGPFAAHSPGSFDPQPPGHVRYSEPWPRRMRAVLAGETVLDSRRGVLVHETGRLPTHYFPLDDFRAGALVPGAERDGARRWSVQAGGRTVEDSVVASPARADGAELLPGHATVRYAAPDRWFEEDDPIYAHPRDPYHRIDVRSGSQHVVVRHDGRLIADTRRPKLLFETANPVRHYVPFADVRLARLTRSDTVSECPYKGDGQHWHVDGVEDAAWSLPHPLPEGLAAAEHICFYPAKMQVEVDGEPAA